MTMTMTMTNAWRNKRSCPTAATPFKFMVIFVMRTEKTKSFPIFFFSATLAAFRVPTAIRGGIIVAESSFHCCRFRSHSRLNVCVAIVISSRRHEQTIENVRFNLKLLDLESKKESAQPLFMKIYFVFYVLAQNTYTKVRIDVSITWFVIFF